MIDWENVTPENFDYEIMAEQIDDQVDPIIFPVRVTLTKTGEHAVDLPIMIRAHFVADLQRKGAEGRDTLVNIIHRRAVQEIDKRHRARPVSVENKINFAALGKMAVEKSKAVKNRK